MRQFRCLLLAAALLYAPAASAQIGPAPAPSGSSTITANTTATQACGVNTVLYSDGSKVQCSATLPSGLTIPGYAPLASPTFTGVSNFPAGSVTNPSASIGNLTTGLYSVSTTGLGFSVNGAEAFDYGINVGSYISIGSATAGIIPHSTGTGNLGTAGFAWSLVAGVVVQSTGSVFSGLSTGSGKIAYITDGLAGNCGDSSCTTFGTTVTGGSGALKLLMWYDGANWTLIGK